MNLRLPLLMLSLLSAGSTRVVQDFEESCGQFFANGKSPTRFTGDHYKQICQTRNKSVHFATFYDTYNKIPVYSAYKFKGITDCTRLDKWYIEPQLDDNNGGANMAYSSTVQKEMRGVHQALNKDYKDSVYDRGHLFPVYHANSQGCANATFTLTNAAPQNPSFNRGQWKELEEDIAKRLVSECKKYSAYIVTGVVPSTNKLKNRVAVPSHFWTAFCCFDNNKKIKISRGFIGGNEVNNTPKNITVTELEKELKNIYLVNDFKLFDLSLKRPREESSYCEKEKRQFCVIS